MSGRLANSAPNTSHEPNPLQLLQLHGHGAHADPLLQQPPGVRGPGRPHRDLHHRPRRFAALRSCQNDFFQRLVIAGNMYKNRPDGDDGWREVTPLCREYSSSRSYPKTEASSAIPEGTVIGPVLEVHVVKILHGYGIEVAIQSIENPEYKTYIVISEEEERFVNEIHDHRRELRSSNELLVNLHESGRNEDRKVTRSHKETWAAPRTKETSANPVILTPGASLFTITIPTNEYKWKVIHAHSRYGGDLAVSVSKLATTMLRHYISYKWKGNMYHRGSSWVFQTLLVSGIIPKSSI